MTMAVTDTLDPTERGLLLELLHCAAHAGGASRAEEEALRGAERVLGPRLGEAVERPLRALPQRTRRLFYAAAVWMTLADGLRVRAETALLQVLAEELDLDREEAAFLERQARWVRTSTDDAPAHEELALLLAETARRIAAIQARRRAA